MVRNEKTKHDLVVSVFLKETKDSETGLKKDLP